MTSLEGSSLPTVYTIGAPGPVGGADTELWHTLRVWRRYGLEVVIVPTWRINTEWRKKCESLGCTVHAPQCAAELLDVPGLRDSVVVSFCNGQFLANAASLRKAGCRIVWANCMTWMFDAEREHFREFGPFDHFLFQSRHQQAKLTALYKDYGYREELGSVIHGAFAFEEFPFRPRPHEPGTPLVIGRISRADPDKYSSNTWSIYSRIPHAIRARLMAWEKRIETKLGTPPSWAECLPAMQETPQTFFSKLHCMVQINGGAGENWPRSGLEAMSSGVPVVVQNEWGWREMIRHGETGYLCNTDEEIAYYTAKLAYEEDLRLAMARRARRVVEEELANPDVLWQAWKEVFTKVVQGVPAAAA